MVKAENVKNLEQRMINGYCVQIDRALKEIDEGFRASIVVRTMDGMSYKLENGAMSRRGSKEIILHCFHPKYGPRKTALSNFKAKVSSNVAEALNVYSQLYN